MVVELEVVGYLVRSPNRAPAIFLDEFRASDYAVRAHGTVHDLVLLDEVRTQLEDPDDDAIPA